ncbi:hypothetical protein DSO57_1026475 [Entomophthora muscae]|uniref:Uncharacterized protein n=1 Tax=Entomophthora muscae TaxID=34485 RepID=A0ACC2TDM4_9FUNG|nr:hypothetical protein DSO57_1026475 [Entomophthora muscae]
MVGTGKNTSITQLHHQVEMASAKKYKLGEIQWFDLLGDIRSIVIGFVLDSGELETDSAKQL